VVVTIALEVVAPTDADGQPNNPIRLLWRTFVSTFSLSGIPDDKTEPFAVIGLWFVLALGGIFVVSALVGLLTSGLSQKMDQLRKGRAQGGESDHTTMLG